MAAVCDVCGKRPGFGHNVPWSKKKTNRRWNPNIQRIRASSGTAKRQNVCTSCLKAAKPPAEPVPTPQVWMTTGMIIGRRRRVSFTHLPSRRRITCCSR